MKSRKVVVVALALILVLGQMATAAWGHQVDRAEQFTEVHPQTGQVENLYMVSAEDLAHELGHVVHGQAPTQDLLNELEEELGAYFDDHTAVRADDEPCELEEAEFVAYPAPDGRLHYYQSWRCPGGVHEIELENRIMHDHHHGGYRHLAQIKVGDEIYPTVFEPQFPAYAVYPQLVGDAEQAAVVEVERTEVEDDDAEEEPSEEDEVDQSILMVLALLALLGVVGLIVFLERR